ncbi:GNAT family N-acetyltransferase [Neobacillus muris]|uniref:GNAT family N-acetyltransferase n=1 Tax=Neobacillus muris TaxID=2941334 RepID=UPI00203C3A28|nr:GNAT family protein [Neobacillus muris]
MIELKYFGLEDIPQLVNWIDSPEFLLQWAGTSLRYPLDYQQLESYVKNANHAHSNIFAYKVIHSDTGKIIGHISLGNVNRENGNARMCRVLIGDQSMKGKGIGSMIIKEVLKIAFNELNLHKVSLAVFDFNQTAIRLYEKMGFTKEGYIREACKIGNDFWNYYEMSILDREWKEKNSL